MICISLYSYMIIIIFQFIKYSFAGQMQTQLPIYDCHQNLFNKHNLQTNHLFGKYVHLLLVHGASTEPRLKFNDI